MEHKFYSQCEEDKQIYEKYICKLKLDNPIYLEMGAMDGIKFSNTYFFEKELNWTGILIEPHPINFKKLCINRPNNKLYNTLISNYTDEVEFTYYETECLSGISGVKSTLTENNINIFYKKNNNNEWMNNMIDNYLKSYFVKPAKLSEIIKLSGYCKIDFFSLDVEGHELSVLESYDWSIPINMFLIENNQDTTTINNLLIEKNYSIIEMIGSNTLYILNDFKKKHNI